MRLLTHPGPLGEALSEPAPLDGDWNWAAWGSVESVPNLDAALRSADGRIVIVTAGDVELRLLGDEAPGWLVPFAALPWVEGCLVPRMADAGSPTTWGEIIAKASGVRWLPFESRTASRPSLVPQPRRAASVGLQTLIRSTCRSPRSADITALEAGWLQLSDDLDASHQCSQSVEGQGKQQSGDYWHAIMHRREPDYGNSKYWFRQFARHAAFASLIKEVALVAKTRPSAKFDSWIPRLTADGRWQPLAFVDCCQQAAASDDMAFRTAVEELQYREMLLLLWHTHRDAVEN